MSFLKGLVELFRLADDDHLPKARRIPNKYLTVSMDGWELGTVALVSLGSFEPAEDATYVLSDVLPPAEGSEAHATLPIWLYIDKGESRVNVMSGKDKIGTISSDPIYVPLLNQASLMAENLVADGTIGVRRVADEVKFKAPKVHVLTDLNGLKRTE